MGAGLLYDSTQCIGCQACAEACKAENQLPPTIEPTTTAYTWTTVTERKGGWLRSLCMHCLEPTCVSVCPVGALAKTEAGAATASWRARSTSRSTSGTAPSRWWGSA